MGPSYTQWLHTAEQRGTQAEGSQGTSYPSWWQRRGGAQTVPGDKGRGRRAFGRRGQVSKGLEAGTKGNPGVEEGGAQTEEETEVAPLPARL